MMTALDEIKDLGRQILATAQEALHKLKGDVTETAEDLRNRVLDATAQALTLYKVTNILARRSESAKTAAELWREARRDFLILLRRVQTRKPLTAPEGLRVISEINDLEEHYIVILRRLAHDADQEYRAYAETAYLLASPANAKRLKEALEETRSGKLPVFDSVKEAKKIYFAIRRYHPNLLNRSIGLHRDRYCQGSLKTSHFDPRL
jgi:hypothetical protein